MRLATRSSALAVVLAAGWLAAPCAAVTLTVDAKSNIFGAGHAVAPDPGGGGGGVLPAAYAFSAAPGQVLEFSSAAGVVSCCGSPAYVGNGPDGAQFASGSTDILPFGGISGILHGQRTMFLAAVFLDDSEPADPAPARLDFSVLALGDMFSSLSPQLRQVFFVGDGLTGTGGGATQVFAVPATATRVYFGFADAFQFGDPSSLPGYYDDNVGELQVEFDVTSGPTPALVHSWGSLKTLYR